jgi:hypothetical protein
VISPRTWPCCHQIAAPRSRRSMPLSATPRAVAALATRCSRWGVGVGSQRGRHLAEEPVGACWRWLRQISRRPCRRGPSASELLVAAHERAVSTAALWDEEDPPPPPPSYPLARASSESLRIFCSRACTAPPHTHTEGKSQQASSKQQQDASPQDRNTEKKRKTQTQRVQVPTRFDFGS